MDGFDPHDRSDHISRQRTSPTGHLNRRRGVEGAVITIDTNGNVVFHLRFNFRTGTRRQRAIIVSIRRTWVAFYPDDIDSGFLSG